MNFFINFAKNKIKVDKNSISKGRVKQRIDKKDTPQGIVDGIINGLKDVEKILTGKQKRQTLKEMFDEC